MKLYVILGTVVLLVLLPSGYSAGGLNLGNNLIGQVYAGGGGGGGGGGPTGGGGGGGGGGAGFKGPLGIFGLSAGGGGGGGGKGGGGGGGGLNAQILNQNIPIPTDGISELNQKLNEPFNNLG